MNSRIAILFKVVLIFFISFVETIILLVILFALERGGVFMIQVLAVDGVLVYPYESGGFFFGLILCTNLLGAVVWYFIMKWIRKKKNIMCCDDISCISNGSPICESVNATFK